MWGTEVGDPITLSSLWPRHAVGARLLSALLCCANMVSYCLDSVPLARWCQRSFFPGFAGGWGVLAVGQFMLIALPSWAFGVLAATFVGAPSGLFTMLAWVTAVTIPALNLILPACFALAASGRKAKEVACDHALLAAAASRAEAGVTHEAGFVLEVPQPSAGSVLDSSGRGSTRYNTTLVVRLSTCQRAGALGVLIIGLGSLLVCLYAAVGKSIDAEVRGPQVIGCVGWQIYHSNGTHFHGW